MGTGCSKGVDVEDGDKKPIRSPTPPQVHSDSYDADDEVDINEYKGYNGGIIEEEVEEDVIEELDLSQYPPRIPPAKKKSEIFNASDYIAWQQRAITSKNYGTPNEYSTLVRYLTDGAETTLQKLRSIFTWITIQDCTSIDDGIIPDFTSPSGYLAALKKDTGSYPDLFKRLCLGAEIPCAIISGYAKGIGYQPGQQLTDEFRASWNAVLIDNYWRLMDTHWGARYVVGDDKSEEWKLIDSDTKSSINVDKKLTYENDDFYFLSDPEKLIYSHFPDDQLWQLLDKPIEKSDFESQAFIKRHFFKLGLSIKSHSEAHIDCDDGTVCIQFALPMNKELSFAYKLYSLQGSAEKSEDMLKQYVIQQVINKIISFEIFFPKSGKYLLEIFSANEHIQTEKNSQSNSDEYFMNQICAYLISCSKASKITEPLPQSSSTKGFGPGIDVIRKQLKPITHTSGVIVTQDGQVEIKFQMEGGMMDFAHYLKSNKYNKEDLKKYVIHRKVDDEVIFSINLPESGDYAFDIFGEKVDEGNALPHLCSYLIRCENNDVKQEPFPVVANGLYGIVNPKVMKDREIKAEVSDPAVIANSGEVNLNFEAGKPTSFVASLEMQDGEKISNFDEYVFIENIDGKTKFSAALPKPGYYKLGVYAKDPGIIGNVPNIYNYVISCDKEKDDCQKFPIPFRDWQEGCQLLEPRYGFLPLNEDVNFSLIVPNAKDVVVVRPESDDGERWTRLIPDSDGVWNCTANTGNKPGDLQVAAVFNEGEYQCLLKYTVADEETSNALRQQNRQVLTMTEENDEELKNKERILEQEKEEEEKRKRELALAAEEEEKKAQQEELLAKKALDEAKKAEMQELDAAAKMEAEDKLRLAKQQALERTHSRIRKQLRVAIQNQNKRDIKEAMKEFKDNDVPDVDGDYGEAQELLYYLKIKKNLVQAIRSREIDPLQKALAALSKASIQHQRKLVLERTKAERILESLKNIEKLRHSIMKLDNKTIAEIKSYSAPPTEVHEVFKATYCILGYSKKSTEKWPDVLVLVGKLGRESLKRKINQHKIANTSMETVLQAEEILSRFSLNDIRDVSSGAAAFYVWVRGIIKEVKQKKEDEALMEDYDDQNEEDL